MVDAKVMHVTLALLLEGVERGKFRAHEREYGLLLVTKTDKATVFGTQMVDYGKLKRIEVLHFVDLYPRIPLAVSVFAQSVIGKLQQVLKIEQTVLAFISNISVGVTSLGQKLRGLVTHALWENRLAHKVKVEVGMIVKVYHERSVERLAHRLSQLFHGHDILRRDTLGMDSQATWHTVNDVAHEM